MTRLTALACLIVLLAGCSRTIEANPVKAPQQVDCNLIFPGPSAS